MKAIDLLEVIGETPETYVLDAANGAPVRKSPKQIWLIAALVALMLVLVGCAVVYMLRMQDLTVGQWRDDVPIIFDENGNQIPIETREPTILLSQQNTNMEALSEWLAFKDAYDPDGSIMTESDKALKSGNPWDIPENYHYTYGCYSQEMVDKLDEIVEKYDLKLLSAMEDFMYYQSKAMLNCMGLESLTYDDTGVEYWGGYLFPEGTLIMDMELDLDMDGWSTREGNFARYRYSVKEYFDPFTSGMKESQEYTQWDYTRKDGTTVLLILNENTARIYADLPEAFVSIHVDPVILVDGEEVPMTQEVLEQMAEFFDLSAKPQATTVENIQKYLEESQAAFDAEKAQQQANHEAHYATGYEEYVKYRLEKSLFPEMMSYILWDVNGDGIKELIINGSDILSMRDGESYQYFSISGSAVIGGSFRPCEGNIFEIYSVYDFVATDDYFFYQAGPEGAEFITGLTHETGRDIWYQYLTDSPESEKKQISSEEAEKILDGFNRVKVDLLPLVKYGQPVTSVNYTEPYAKYIADKLDRYGEAVDYTYTLMDLDGDGQEELITRDAISEIAGERHLLLNIHTIRDGELVFLEILGISNICEGGILESAEDFVQSEDRKDFHAYYRYTGNAVQHIETIRMEPISKYWSHRVAGGEYQPVSEEKAQSIINSYKRIELDMKPFTEYPFK